MARRVDPLDVTRTPSRGSNGWVGPSTLDAMPDSPERTRLYQQMAKLVAAYAPWKINTHRIRTDLWHPHVVGYHRQLLASTNFWKYIDIDLATLAQRGAR